MSEDISAGVKILLERGKTSPDELKEEYGKWSQLRDAVFAYKERKERGPWLRGLTEHEIDLLFDMFNTAYRSVFDGWVMKTVLGAGEQEEDVIAQRVGAWQMAQGKRVSPHSIQPGGIYATSVTDTSTTSPSIIARLKQELGIK